MDLGDQIRSGSGWKCIKGKISDGKEAIGNCCSGASFTPGVAADEVLTCGWE